MYLFSSLLSTPSFFFFFFNDPATTEIYTLSLHDALPISSASLNRLSVAPDPGVLEVNLPPTASFAEYAALCETVFQAGLRRSEERRVGKECRSRWSPEH